MEFTPLRITTVKPLRELTFDLYIHFKEQYLCYAKRGEQLSEEKFLKLKAQKIAKFFITEGDESNYQKFLDALLDETLSNPKVDIEEKVSMAEGAAESAVERMQKDPGSESAYRATEKAAKSMRQVILNNPDALKKIFGKKADKSEEVIKHSLNVCALSVKLAEILKCSEKEMDDIGTAALIHDIGMTNMSKADMELFYKPKKLLSNDDKRVYYMHTKDAASLLKDKAYVTPAILELVSNHEEVLSGLGPNKKKKLSLSEEILSLVNNYDKRTITNKTSPAQTLKDMMIDELGNYDLKLLNEFKKVLHTEGLLLE
ncbi:HD domain-containing phosphohydrolase [Bacteriovorax sp. PP10]|uniref:HD domain-containing phosphohydrolase n=1 Tax=Bacteriovorax antarcticus TaxID=3088717 RepID=A0ABU5VS35_9BACT|nr:HD domain-containing phosphohydrolase [Bacteriovorax sp. PP10]MEA9355866.1 HD domain-containing phosphohydrolase [Bacteriovorax sp. PP10]